MSKAPAKQTPMVGALVNAIAILRQLVAQRAPSGVNALARAAGVSPSSSYNILRTLVAEGLVDFHPVAKTYSPGPGLFALAMQAANDPDAFARCAFLLGQFAEAHGATVGLWRVTPSERLVLVGVAQSKSATRIDMTVGYRLPLLAGAGGRCMAYAIGLTKAVIAERFAELRWANPPTLETYLREVEESRKRGWALDNGNLFAGIETVSVPIVDAQGRPMFVVAASFFQMQRSKAQLANSGKELTALAPKVATALGLVNGPQQHGSAANGRAGGLGSGGQSALP